MHILSIESSTAHFSIAVSQDSKVLKSKSVKSAKLLENAINKAIDDLLSACGLIFKDIDAYAVGLGPGSFTSLRVGLSTVKAFCLATQKPVVGFSSLELIATAIAKRDGREIVVIADARRGMVYAAIYEDLPTGLRLKGEPFLADIKTVLDHIDAPATLVGDGLSLYAKDIKAIYQAHNKGKKDKCTYSLADEKFWYPHAKVLAQFAYKAISAGVTHDILTLEPIYLYPADCQVQQKHLVSPLPRRQAGPKV